jgi:tetratricopeptide (TPR) repeat protein
MWLGRYDAALPEAREAVRLAPHSSLASVNFVIACLGVGDIAEARAAVAQAAASGQDDLTAHQNRVFLAMLDGDRAALEREIRWASGNPGWRLWVLRARAGEAMAAGRLREARQLYSEAVAVASQSRSAPGIAEIHLNRAEAEALLGNPQIAMRAMEDSLALDGDAVVQIQSAVVLGLLGDATRSRMVIAAVQDQQPATPTIRRVWLPVALALDAATRGRADEAARALQPAVRFEQGYAFDLAPVGVRAIIEGMAGRPDRAAAAFRDLLRVRGPHVVSRWVPFARLGLARALRDAGDVAGSLAAYDAFLESWKNADADAPLLIAARQERAALAAR